MVYIYLVILFILIILIYKYYHTQNIVFVTYGNEKFKKSRERIVNEAKQLDLFTDCIMETEDVFNDREFKEQLTNERFKQVATSNKGGGYWLWKPYIIHKHLSNLNEGDILVYSDAGCQITNDTNTINSFNEIFDKIKNSHTNMVLNKLPNEYTEKHWTKGDVLDYYNVYNKDNISDTLQLEGGRIVLIKNKETMDIINQWWNTAKNRPELFDDSQSRLPNKDGFIDHRHDQSNISILCKLNGCCDGADLDFIKVSRIRE
tara:strand:+ start:231 stop:1010 length:780 start_codon:yes stop_codon:yes gene_type:complete